MHIGLKILEDILADLQVLYLVSFTLPRPRERSTTSQVLSHCYWPHILSEICLPGAMNSKKPMMYTDVDSPQRKTIPCTAL